MLAIPSQHLPHCLNYPDYIPNTCVGGGAAGNVSQQLRKGHPGTPPTELAAGQHFRLLWECVDTGQN